MEQLKGRLGALQGAITRRREYTSKQGQQHFPVASLPHICPIYLAAQGHPYSSLTLPCVFSWTSQLLLILQSTFHLTPSYQ